MNLYADLLMNLSTAELLSTLDRTPATEAQGAAIRAEVQSRANAHYALDVEIDLQAVA